MQMTIFHYNERANGYRQQWQGWQASTNSYPSLLRKVAVANGSGNAIPQAGMSPGMQLLHSDNGLFSGYFPRLVTGLNYAYALPGVSSRGHDNVIMRYRKPYSITNNWHYYYADPSWGYYDTAPGSSTRVAGDARDESDGALRADWDTNTFMATISALDIQDAGSINSPNLGYNVKQQIPVNDRPNRAKYAFDAYFAADNVNEPHVQITNAQGSTQGNNSYSTDNGSWIQNELRESAHHMPAVLANQRYNYGSPYRHLLPSVQVNSWGELDVNIWAFPVNGGTAATQGSPSQANFDVYTSNCATVVQVNDNGGMYLGDTSGHTASLDMSANSLLDIGAGGYVGINTGSVMRIKKGATLVVRDGAELYVGGQLIVEAGAYICAANQSGSGYGIVVGSNGTFTVDPSANYGTNPALNLTNTDCTVPAQDPLYVNITNLSYLNYCTSPSGQSNYAQWTAAATGSTGVYAYQWYFDASGTGNNYGGVVSNGTTFGTCLNGYSFYVRVKVVVTSGTQTASAEYYAQPQTRTAMYPNPADTYVDVANEDPDASASKANASNQSQSFATSSAVEPTKSSASPPVTAAMPMQVTVYNGQAQMVFDAANVTAPSVHLNTQAWPEGLYQVVVRRGQTTTRRQLSIQH